MNDVITRPCVRCGRRERSWSGWYAVTILSSDVVVVQYLTDAPGATSEQEVFCGQLCLGRRFQGLIDTMANAAHGSPVGGPIWK